MRKYYVVLLINGEFSWKILQTKNNLDLSGELAREIMNLEIEHNSKVVIMNWKLLRRGWCSILWEN